MAESDAKVRTIEQEFERRKAAKQLDGWEKPKPKDVQKFIPHAELHKKTYFKAVEKMLVVPQEAPSNQNEIDPNTWGSQMILEDSIKHPPHVAGRVPQNDNDQEWYDNFIEPHNLVVRRSPKYSRQGH
jgi:hypothetical protein